MFKLNPQLCSKKTLAQVFPCEFCKISTFLRTPSFTEHNRRLLLLKEKFTSTCSCWFAILQKTQTSHFLFWRKHYAKIVRIRSFSGQYFPTFGLKTERYSVFLRIQSECWKLRSRKTPKTDTFRTVKLFQTN